MVGANAVNDRLTQQMQFVMELDKLKGVLRQTLLTDRSRQENSAEHSWHLALMAIALAEYATQPVQLDRVIQMLLVHDVVEIDAGDTFCYDSQGNHSKADREQAAADRLFGLLPPEQATHLRTCWDEFEAGTSAEAQFANALDRLQPFLNNLETAGHTWKLHGVTRQQVLDRMRPVKLYLPALWHIVEQGIETAIAHGYLKHA